MLLNILLRVRVRVNTTLTLTLILPPEVSGQTKIQLNKQNAAVSLMHQSQER